MIKKIKEAKTLVFFGLPVILAILLSLVMQFTVMAQPEKFTGWLSSFGPYVVLVYIIVQSITLLIPPLGGMFIWIGMLVILGPVKGLILSYLVTTPVYCLNFLLARKYGRSLVAKVAGKGGMAKIDHFSVDAGVGTLWILKIFQNGYFDYISYAAGLTKISLHDYLVVNFLGGIPSTLLTYFILIKSPNFVTSMVFFYIMAGVLVGISIIITHWRKKH